MSEKIVLCVLAGELGAVQGLVDLLGDRFTIIVHLDAKSSVLPEFLVRGPLVHLADQRFPIFWGGFNMCQAAIGMIDQAYRIVPDFERLALITGDTQPIVTPDALARALGDTKREYIHLQEVESDPSLRSVRMDEAHQHPGGMFAWRFQNYVHSDDVLTSPRSRADLMRKYDVSENVAHYIAGSVSAIIQELFESFPWRTPLYSKLYYGESWWALSRAAIDLILDDLHSPIHREFFRYLHVPDEHFFQTLVGSKLIALAASGRQCVGPLVYVDHANPARRAFDGSDHLSVDRFACLEQQTDRLFARKYDPKRTPEVAAAIGEGRYFTQILGR